MYPYPQASVRQPLNLHPVVQAEPALTATGIDWINRIPVDESQGLASLKALLQDAISRRDVQTLQAVYSILGPLVWHAADKRFWPSSAIALWSGVRDQIIQALRAFGSAWPPGVPSSPAAAGSAVGATPLMMQRPMIAAVLPDQHAGEYRPAGITYVDPNNYRWTIHPVASGFQGRLNEPSMAMNFPDFFARYNQSFIGPTVPYVRALIDAFAMVMRKPAFRDVHVRKPAF